MKILIMGLPTSGKTTLANELEAELMRSGFTVQRLNADAVRAASSDWDFSYDGRMRQAFRMQGLADESSADFVVADFVAPTPELRDIFAADYLVFMDTVEASPFADTNSVFERPREYNRRVTYKNHRFWAKAIVADLIGAMSYV